MCVYCIEIFGHLTSLGEHWNMMSLPMLQNFDPGLKTFKQFLCQHWMDIAGVRATSMISRDTGGSFPSSFDRNLKHSLELHGQVPFFDWTQVSRVLVSLDWNFQKNDIPSFEDVLMTAHNSDRLRGKFAGFLEQENLQMIHVQLALSCCGVARVDGPINAAWVDMLAELLCYRLMIEKSEEIDSLQIDHGEIHPGMLILVSQVSDCTTASRLELYPDTPSTRMIISVDSEIDTALL